MSDLLTFRKSMARFLPKSMREETPIVPVVRLSGVIGSGRGLAPGSDGLSLANVAGALRGAFNYKRAKAVALLINSPGGSPVQSHLIYKRIKQLKAERNLPVFAFLEDVAASGGYMIACAADEIIADQSTIVGSIGVVSAGFGFPETLKKLGIERRVYTSGKSKSQLDPFQPEKKEDIAHLKALQEEIHAFFIALVKENRGDVLKGDESELFSGQFWAGETGMKLGLVDRIGDMRGVLRERFGENVLFRPYGPERTLFGRKIPSVFGGQNLSDIGRELPKGLVESLEERALWARYGL